MRDLSNSITDAAIAQGAYPIELVEVIVDPTDSTQQIYTTSAYQDISFDGNTYLAAGYLLRVSQIDETRDVKTNSIDITLDGIDDSIVAAIASSEVVGSIVTIYRGYWSDDTNAIVGEPFQIWSGIINNYATTISNERSGAVTIQISCKNLLAALLSQSNGRFTSDSSFKNGLFSDASMEFVSSLANFNPRFGSES